MEPEIRRVNFFDGQFLKQGEFQAEQLYHRHMRRRLNYMLFNGSGVVPATPEDLNFFAIDAVSRTVRVRAGMAISRKDDTREGLEIVLRQDSVVFDLGAAGIGAGQRAWFTVHYEELEVADPPSEGDVDAPTRVDENAVVVMHPVDPSASSPANGEEYIVLGSIAFDDMSVDTSQRQVARISAAVVEGAGPAPVPSLVGITLTALSSSISVGGTLGVTATGQFSSGPDQVLDPTTLTWDTSDPGVATVAADGLVTGVGAGGVAITAQSDAILSTALEVTVTAATVVVTIDAVIDNLGAAGDIIGVVGSNLHDQALPVGGDAADKTIVRFIDNNDPDNSSKTVARVGAPVSGSPQRLDVEVPPTSNFPIPPTPLVTFINIEIQFGGGLDTAVSAFRYSA